MPIDFDCLIIGSGLVGGSLACALDFALRDYNIKIGIVEAFQVEPGNTGFEPDYNDRGLGISPSSQRILAGIGLWEALQNYATPIHHIHVSDRGHFGFTRISAENSGVPQLGHVVIGKVLGQTIQNRIGQSRQIQMFCPAKVDSIKTTAEQAIVHILGKGIDQTISTRLLIVADGGHSEARSMLSVESEEKDYRQTAIVTNVTPEIDHNHTAYERLTSTGPLALLPISEQRCVAVWTVNSEQADAVLDLDDQAFLKSLGQRFGHRLGEFTKVGKRRGHPMQLIRARQLTGERFAIIGNAAHSIHPNAAQGLNLGLRDVAQLAEQIVDAVRFDQDPGRGELLADFSASRQHDHHQVIRFSDGLTRLFYNNNPALITLRNLAMLGLDLVPVAKRSLTRRAMGLHPHPSSTPPRLIRGLAL